MLEIPEAIQEALGDVYDPCCRDLGISVLDMGLIRTARLVDGVASVEMILTSGWCPFVVNVVTSAKEALQRIPGVREAEVTLTWSEPWCPDRLSEGARAKLRFLPAPKDVPSASSHLSSVIAKEGALA